MNEVADLLNREGVPHRGPWTRDAVKDIWRRGRFYLGFVVEKRGRDERPGQHESILTEAQYGGRFKELALRIARRANELTEQGNWAYVDTLALAEFEAGHVSQAIELEQKAIGLSKAKAGGSGMADMQKALARFKAALEGQAAAEARTN